MDTCDCILCSCCCGYYSIYSFIFCLCDHLDKQKEPLYNRINSDDEESEAR